MTHSMRSRRGVADDSGGNVYHASHDGLAYVLSFPDGCGYYASPLEPTGPRICKEHDGLAYSLRFPDGCGFYASPLEPTGPRFSKEVWHGLGNPTLDDTRTAKSVGESKLTEEPSSVTGYYSEEEEETVYLLKCLDGTGQPESLETCNGLKLAIAPPKRFKAQNFYDAQMLNSSNELKLSQLPSIMAQNEVLRDACMHPLICPHSTSSPQPQRTCSLEKLEQIVRNSSKMMACHSCQSKKDTVATVPCKSPASPTTKRIPRGYDLQSPALGRQEIGKIRAKAHTGTTSNSKVIETRNSTSKKRVHDLGNPIVDDMELVKTFGVPKLIEAPRNVTGKSSEEIATILFKCPEGAGNPESLEPTKFHETAKWNTPYGLKPAMGPSKRLKTPKFDNTQMFSSSNELKLSASSGVMAKNEGLRDAYMDPLMCPDPTNSFESQRTCRLDSVDHVTRKSSKIMERHSLDSRENVVALVPCKPCVSPVNIGQLVLGTETAEARTDGENPTWRRASASRRFPLGCGRQSPVLTQLEIEKIRARAQAGAASDTKAMKTRISIRSDKVNDDRSPSLCIAKKSRAQLMMKGNMCCDGDYPGRKNQVGSRDRSAATSRNEEGFPIVSPKVSSKHNGKAIVGFVDDPHKLTTTASRYEGKAVLMFAKHPGHISGKRTVHPKNEAQVARVKKCSTQQSEYCRKFMDNPKSTSVCTNARERIERILHHFRMLLQDKETKATRPDLKIFRLMKERGMTPSRKYLGAVPGVEIGDEFRYRGELMATGLHCSPVAGIDSMLYSGIKVATCIISSGGYTNFVDSAGAFIYSGEGGNPNFERKRKRPLGDQKLERGNLALRNSIDTQTPVRVIHGLKNPGARYSLKTGVSANHAAATYYVYDGLYKVERFWSDIEHRGHLIFKFQLRRLPGQPELASKQVENVKGVEVHQPQFFLR